MATVEEMRDQALEVARGWSGPDAPPTWRLTAALFEAIADHDDLLGALTFLPPARLPALLASAAIAYLARQDTSGALGSAFPEPGSPQPAFDEGFFDAFRGFCATHLDDIVGVCRDHRYQMNEVARSTQIALGITALIAGRAAEPVALVDLGTGAGLGLQLDRYGYRVGEREGGAPGALRLSCEVRGGTPPAPALPPIAERIGIEVDPIDLDDPASRRWLESCVPPEASALGRLAEAVEVARRHPVTIVAGDLVAELPGVLAALPEGRRTFVVDSYVAVFLTAEQRRRVVATLAEAGQSRPVTWLSLDPLVPLGPSGDRSVQDLDLPDSLIDDNRTIGVFAILGARTFDGDRDESRLLARAHPSGSWVEWLA